MDKDTSIPFDQYQRYGVAAKAINAIRVNNEPLNILEVGANTHRLLGKLLPNDRIVYLDREFPLEMQGYSDVIVGDATDRGAARRGVDGAGGAAAVHMVARRGGAACRLLQKRTLPRVDQPCMVLHNLK